MTSQQRRLKGNIIASRIITLILILALTGCASIQLISEYDKEIDIAVTAFQKKMTKFLISLERNIGKEKSEYRNNTEFYDEIRVDLRQDWYKHIKNAEWW